MILKSILSRFQVHDISLSSDLKLNIIVNYLKQQYEILKFKKLQKNFFRVQTQLNLEFIFDAFIDSKTTL